MKVSIIVPVYNASAFIKECVDSVRSQTMTEGVECILIDDRSTDNTLEKIQSIINVNANENVYFSLLSQERNQGPSAARNRGIREAKGEYVFFLDADDMITPDCIESLYGLARLHDADYVQGRYESKIEDNKDNKNNANVNINRKNIELLNSSTLEPSIPSALTDRKEIKRLLLNHNKLLFAPHNRLVRRQMIIDNSLFFNEQIKVREDFLWMTFVAKYVKKFASCDKPTYRQGYNEDSLTHSINKEREIAGYRVLIEQMVANYDSFQLGYQKELALEALMMALRAGYYHDEAERKHLIDVIKSKNNSIENFLLALYLRTENSKILHVLVRLYKM